MPRAAPSPAPDRDDFVNVAADALAGRATGVRPYAWGAAALAAGIVVMLASLAGLPFQDAPNHLSRAVAIADLLYDGGRRYGAMFEFEWHFVPYVLGDAWHVATLAVLPPDVAARAWMIVGFLSIPLATLALLRTWRCSPYALAAGGATAVYLAGDWFLLLGFLNFRYGLALALLALVAWERVRARPTAGRWTAWLLLVTATYLMHLAALLMLVVAVGTLSAVRLWHERGWRDRARLAGWVLAGAPPVVALALHVAFGGGKEVGLAVQPELVAKVLRVAAPLVPFREPVEVLLGLAFVAALAVPLLASRPREWPPRAREALALAAAFFATYVALPEVRGQVWGVDFRALPFAWLFLAVGAVLVAEARARRVGLLPAAVLAIGALHVATLWPALAEQDAHNRAYRRIAAHVPAGAPVLPIVTRPRAGLLSPSAHAGSFAVIDAVALVPYTFTGDQFAPMPYFRFRRPPPRHPGQWWYVNRDPPRSWAGRLEDFDYALVEVPAQWSRIPLRGRVLAGNDTVVLLDLRGAARARTVHDGARLERAARDVRPRGGVRG